MSERAPRSANRMLARRVPVDVLIQQQRARLAKLDERIGHMMTARADEEQILADLIEHSNRRFGVECRSCRGTGKVRDGESDELRSCLDCAGDGRVRQ